MSTWKKLRNKARPSLKRLASKRRTPPGAMPGTVLADPRAPKPKIRLFQYDCDSVEERSIGSAESLAGVVGQKAMTWVDITGLGDAQTLEAVGRIFGLHRLELEDIVNTHQRAKVEDYDDHLYIVMREAVAVSPETGEAVRSGDADFGGPHGPHIFESDQISICMGAGWVLTFQEIEGDSFDPVRDRIRRRKGKLCALGSDALAYALIDAIIDSYFPMLEHIGEHLDVLEEAAATRVETRTAHAIHDVKRELLTIRRAVWPAREAVSTLLRGEHPLFTPDTRLYLRDCYDHLVQLIDVIETYREIGSGLMDIYLASMSNRMNEIMKVLTIISTIFIPLGFIAGVYGMNFDTRVSPWNMPELEWRFGYFWALGVMAAMAAGLLVYFVRKGWIGGAARARRIEQRSRKEASAMRPK